VHTETLWIAVSLMSFPMDLSFCSTTIGTIWTTAAFLAQFGIATLLVGRSLLIVPGRGHSSHVSLIDLVLEAISESLNSERLDLFTG